MRGGWTRRLWAEAASAYAAILTHPFLAFLTDGSLDSERFTHHVVQDAHYLRDFARTLTVVSSKAPTHAGGLASSVFLDFIDSSVLSSKLISAKGRAIGARDYEPTVTTTGMRKDFDLRLAAAQALEVPMLIAASTHQLLPTAIGHGYGESDYVALYAMAAYGAALPVERLERAHPTDS